MAQPKIQQTARTTRNGLIWGGPVNSAGRDFRSLEAFQRFANKHKGQKGVPTLSLDRTQRLRVLIPAPTIGGMYTDLQGFNRTSPFKRLPDEPSTNPRGRWVTVEVKQGTKANRSDVLKFVTGMPLPERTKPEVFEFKLISGNWATRAATGG